MRRTERGEGREGRRRWVLLLLIAGVVALVALAAGADSTVMRTAYPVGAVATGALLLGMLAGRLQVAHVLPGLMAVGVGLSTALGASVLTSPAPSVEVRAALFRAVVVVAGLTFLALGPRIGQVISLVYVLVATILMVVLEVPLLGTGDLSPGVVETVALLLAMVAILRTLSARVETLERSAEEASESAALAYRDELTALPNRRQLALHLGESISRARAGGPVDAVVMFDLDHFKAVNDTMGHNVGDDVLRRTAAIATAAVREADIVGRWGGEEFVALLHAADEAQAVRVAERCRRALEGIGGATGVTASFGVTTLSRTDDVSAVIGRADAALYAAKQAGRNRTVTRQPPDAPPVQPLPVDGPTAEPPEAEEAPVRPRAQIRLDAHLEPDPDPHAEPPEPRDLPARRPDHDGDGDGDGDPAAPTGRAWRPR